MSMLLCSAEKGVNFYVNDPFERTFAPAGRMRKSVDHQEQRVDEIRSVAWVAAWVRSIDASIDVDGWMDGWTRTDLEHISTHKHTYGRCTDEMMVESRVPLDFLPLMYVFASSSHVLHPCETYPK
jgi:hypothetical protein